MRIVDTRGQLCPAPLIMAKRALKTISQGESFVILTDNITSFNNLNHFLRDNNTNFEYVREEEGWKITVKKVAANTPETKPEDYCVPVPHFEKGDYDVVISSDKMGEGDDDLGKVLITNFIKALKDLDKLPRRIIFYNSGVKLVANTSAQIEDLSQLEKMGVEIILCATCVNHYNIGSVLGAGTLSNMFTIAESLATASKIIKP